MLKAQPRKTIPFHVLNTIGRALQVSNAPIARFDEESVHKTAIKATGLDDFGDDYYREGLLQLLNSAENDAQLHFIGRMGLRRLITLHLANRLNLVEARKRSPEVFQQPLIPPLIIFGLPRSGTTFLHRLLAVDPAHRTLPFWEVIRHFPHGTPDRRRQIAMREVKVSRLLYPDLDHKHYVRVDTPEECVSLLAPTFFSKIYWTFAPVYGYLEWYFLQDRLRPYQEYRWILQALQARDPTRRLNLKAPAHMGALDALSEVIPDALLIQTHRDPVRACNSHNSLLYTLHSSVVKKLDLVKTIEANVGAWEQDTIRNLAARDARPGAIFDVYFKQLVADPVGTVRTIYDHFGFPWTEEHEQRLQSYIHDNHRWKYGRHQYSSFDFGMTDDAIAKRFEMYRERFGYAK